MSHVQGLHHVTAMASDARATDAFHAGTLGLRRVKKTVNFDAPEVYHLYYGDRTGTPGTVMTHFPFPRMTRGARGSGEVGRVAYAVPDLAPWRDRVGGSPAERFGEPALDLEGPDGEAISLVQTDDPRAPWTALPEGMAIRGVHAVTARVADPEPTRALLRFMGYRDGPEEGGRTRMLAPGHGHVDVERTDMPPARQGAGSVHHIAFRVPDRAAQDEMRARLIEAGARVTPPIDRDYFWAIYFMTPGGILFEIATDEPGFTRDEPVETLGRSLRLPAQHARLRERLERTLPPLD